MRPKIAIFSSLFFMGALIAYAVGSVVIFDFHGSGDYSQIGNSSAFDLTAIRFVATTTMTVDTLGGYFRLHGSPSDKVTASLEADSAGVPSGVPLTYTQLTIANSSFAFYSQPTFGTGNITAGDVYWLVYGRTGSVDASNYFDIQAEYPGSSIYCRVDNGGTWTTAGTGCDAYAAGEYISTSTPAATSTALSAGDELDTYLLYVLDAVFFFLFSAVILFGLNKIYPILS